MKEFENQTLKGERALFRQNGLNIISCAFEDGESPLKECTGIMLTDSAFRWKYPLWYCKNVNAVDCVWEEMARAGVWYSEGVRVKDSLIRAPKNFRRAKRIVLENVEFTNAAETLWTCEDVCLNDVRAVKGDYFLMNCRNVVIDGLRLDGNYSLDGAKNVVVRNSHLMTKDAFWNSENVTVYDSYICGEYLGWNSKNLTLIGCTVESLQGMCYIENLKMTDCRLVNTTLAFEYSSVDVRLNGGVDSVFNPASGRIEADYIGELILEKDEIDPEKTVIVCGDVRKYSDKPEWKR